MLGLLELRRAVTLLDEQIAGQRVQAVSQPDAASVVLTLYGGPQSGRSQLRLSCRARCARVSLIGAEARTAAAQAAAPSASPPMAAAPRVTSQPSAFLQYLRAHVVVASVVGARLIGDDRQLALRLRAPERELDLLLAIFGARSNLYLLAADGSILSSLRPLAETRPDLQLGAAWSSPAQRPHVGDADRFAAERDERFLFAVEEHYARIEQQLEGDELRARIERALHKQAKSLERNLAKLEVELEDARAASRLEREGELLKSVLSQVRRGDSEVTARDFDTGECVAIELDPTRTPAQNLEQRFQRYRKALRSLTKAGAREAELRRSKQELEVWIQRFRALADDPEAGREAFERFAEQPAIRSALARHQPAGAEPHRATSVPAERRRGKPGVPNRLMPRRYRTAGGLEIWVGRSAEGNDHLSLRLARGRDLFFHLDGAPGSHVVLRTEGRGDPPAEAMLDACELAVHFSKSKRATRADVHAVPIANVRKPKGAKPGLVTVHGGKTIHLRRSDARLERVLANRIDE